MNDIAGTEAGHFFFLQNVQTANKRLKGNLPNTKIFPDKIGFSLTNYETVLNSLKNPEEDIGEDLRSPAKRRVSVSGIVCAVNPTEGSSTNEKEWF